MTNESRASPNGSDSTDGRSTPVRSRRPQLLMLLLLAVGAVATLGAWALRGARVLAHDGGVLAVAFSSSGLLATGDSNGVIRLWSPGDLKLLVEIRAHDKLVNGLAFSPAGDVLASAGSDGVKTWSVPSGTAVSVLTPRASMSVAFAPDGGSVAAGGFLKIAMIPTKTGGKEVVRSLDDEIVVALAVSPTGDLVADGDVLLSAADLKPVRQLPGHTKAVCGVAFSPDGKLVATAGLDSLVVLSAVADGSVVRTLAGHTDKAQRVAFSPDGRLLASSGDDRTVRLWSVADGRQLAVWTGHAIWVRALAFSPDGKSVVSGSEDGTARVWRVPE